GGTAGSGGHGRLPAAFASGAGIGDYGDVSGSDSKERTSLSLGNIFRHIRGWRNRVENEQPGLFSAIDRNVGYLRRSWYRGLRGKQARDYGLGCVESRRLAGGGNWQCDFRRLQRLFCRRAKPDFASENFSDWFRRLRH